jgi:hypothetical protein
VLGRLVAAHDVRVLPITAALDLAGAT